MIDTRIKEKVEVDLMPVPKKAVKVQSKIQQLWMTNFLGYHVVQVWDQSYASSVGKIIPRKIWWLKK